MSGMSSCECGNKTCRWGCHTSKPLRHLFIDGLLTECKLEAAGRQDHRPPQKSFEMRNLHQSSAEHKEPELKHRFHIAVVRKRFFCWWEQERGVRKEEKGRKHKFNYTGAAALWIVKLEVCSRGVQAAGMDGWVKWKREKRWRGITRSSSWPCLFFHSFWW